MSALLPIDLLHPDPAVLERAADVIRRGGVIVYPTETLYGIGANALDTGAVRRVAAVKGRADDKPILVIVSGRAALPALVGAVPPAALRLMDAFWPGPLTLVFAAAEGIPREVTAGTGTIGIRIPSSEVCLRLVDTAGCPLTSTSANVSGREAPQTVAEIFASLGEGVDLYLDGGELPARKPSTVVDVTVSPPGVLREGALSVAQLRTVVPVRGAREGAR